MSAGKESYRSLPTTVEEALASGVWQERIDPSTKKPYYYNTKTKATTINLKLTLKDAYDKAKAKEEKDAHIQFLRQKRIEAEESQAANENQSVPGTVSAAGIGQMKEKQPATGKTPSSMEKPSLKATDSKGLHATTKKSVAFAENSVAQKANGSGEVETKKKLETDASKASGESSKLLEQVDRILSAPPSGVEGNKWRDEFNAVDVLDHLCDTQDDVDLFLHHWIHRTTGHLHNEAEIVRIEHREVQEAQHCAERLSRELAEVRGQLLEAKDKIRELELALYRAQCLNYYGSSDVYAGTAAVTHPRATRARIQFIQEQRRKRYDQPPKPPVGVAPALDVDDIYQRAAYLQEMLVTLQEVNRALYKELEEERMRKPCDACSRLRTKIEDGAVDTVSTKEEYQWLFETTRGTQYLPSVSEALCPHRFDSYLDIGNPNRYKYTGYPSSCPMYPPMQPDDRVTQGKYRVPSVLVRSTLEQPPFSKGSSLLL